MSEIDTSSGGGIAARLARLNLQAAQNDSTNSHPAPRIQPPTRLINEVSWSPIGPRPSTHRRPSQEEEEETDSPTNLRSTIITATDFPTKRERPPPPPLPGRVPPPPPPQAPAAAGQIRSLPPPPPSQPPAAARGNISTPPPPPSQPPAAIRRVLTAPPPPASAPSLAFNATPPKLPTRKASTTSLNSISSVNSVRSLPPAWNGKHALSVQFAETKSNGLVKGTLQKEAPASTASSPRLPPRLPPRRTTGAVLSLSTSKGEEEEVPPPKPPRPQVSEPTTPRRWLPPPPSATIPPPPSATVPSPPPLPSIRPTPPSPPPVPMSSRPRPPPLPPSTHPQIPLYHPSSRPTPPLSPSHKDSICLCCRDFTLADTIAAAPHLSRKTVPSLKHLATALSAPFPNSTLDIARAIFTWLHHNIAYDTKAFFGNSAKRMTPQDTLATGLAVCQGYAELFVELARLGGGIDPAHVRHIGGAAKAYGYIELKPGDPIPEQRGNHAWNAVYVPELGRWHLVDPCWGAGHITGPPNAAFHKTFNPRWFTSSVEEFGRRHFPENLEDQFIANPLSWEEFITMEMREGKRPTVYTNFKEDGFLEDSVTPKLDRLDDDAIAQVGGRVTFSFAKTCPHVAVDLSKERLHIVTIDGVNEQWVLDPPPRDAVPGTWEAVTWSVTIDFWNDLNLRGVRMDGRKVSLMNFRDVEGRDATGMSGDEWARKKGRVGYVLSKAVGWNLEA